MSDLFILWRNLLDWDILLWDLRLDDEFFISIAIWLDPWPTWDTLLLEDWFNILLETWDKILLETTWNFVIDENDNFIVDEFGNFLAE